MEMNKKITIHELFLNFIKGLFIGFLNGIPFFQVNHLKSTLNIKENEYLKLAKSDEGYISFGRQLGYLISHYFTYMIAFIIGFAIFFFIPVTSLINDYTYALSCFIATMSLGFLFFEFHNITETKKVNGKHIFFSIILMLAVIVGFYFVHKYFSENPLTIEYSNKSYLIIALLMVLASFTLTFSGMSLTTILFVVALYSSFSDIINLMLYDHQHLIILALITVSILIGSLLAIIMKRQFKSLYYEKIAINVGLYSYVLFYLIVNYIGKGPTFSAVSTFIAQYIIIGCAAFAGLVISIVLTLHGYKKVHKQEEKGQ